ncbi:hypothetical protein LENED_005627 [Lentinula edodes]|uniref:Uncharacterized protein n=1 Tax=Lentinula edodes TaxID=5353 RepID=A0A1Q3E9V4_LENED|nr:hypothetical protein LENED_005627 [Lentinula edodes]
MIQFQFGFVYKYHLHSPPVPTQQPPCQLLGISGTGPRCQEWTHGNSLGDEEIERELEVEPAERSPLQVDSAFEVLGHSVSDEMVCLPLALGSDSPLVMELSARGVYTAFGREVLHQRKEQVFGIRLVP